MWPVYRSMKKKTLTFAICWEEASMLLYPIASRNFVSILPSGFGVSPQLFGLSCVYKSFCAQATCDV